MNLHAIASQVIPAVNPRVPALLQVSNQATTNPDGSRTPKYLIPSTPVFAQVQPISWRDLQQVDGLNLQGTRVVIFLSGELDAIIRVNKKGGDLVTIQAGVHAGIYLTAIVLEQWANWVKLAATLQNGS